MLKMIKPAIVLFLTCAVVTGLLALTYSVTRDTISGREGNTLIQAREAVLGEASSFEQADITGITDEPFIKEAYIGKDESGVIVGVAITAAPMGYAGEIKLLAGIRTDGTIEAVRIVEHEETPGLGARVEDEGFISAFEDLFSEEELVVVKTGKTYDNEIEAVTGATISSKAVTEGVNAARRAAAYILAEAGEQ